jgi:hypothetical protein
MTPPTPLEIGRPAKHLWLSKQLLWPNSTDWRCSYPSKREATATMFRRVAKAADPHHRAALGALRKFHEPSVGTSRLEHDEFRLKRILRS